MTLDDLPARRGPRPTTTASLPHSQLDQTAPTDLQDRLRDHALALPQVRRGPGGVSVPGSVAFFLDAPPRPAALPDLFAGEWGHVHPHRDGSLHLSLPTAAAERVIAQGWGEFHYLVTQGVLPPVVVLVFGPRDEDELEIACRLVEVAYLAAGGAELSTDGRRLGRLSTSTA